MAHQREYDMMDRAMGHGYKISGGRGVRGHQKAAEAAARRQEAYYVWRYGRLAPSKPVNKEAPTAQNVEEFDASFDQKENKNQQQAPKSSETSDKPQKIKTREEVAREKLAQLNLPNEDW
jgi:hypothetical protein